VTDPGTAPNKSEGSFAKLSISDFADATAANQPTPGGGSVLGVIAGQSIALLQMVFAYSVGRKAVAEHADELRSPHDALALLRDRCLELADADADAYAALSALVREKSTDQDARRDAALASAGVPIELMEAIAEALSLAASQAVRTSPYLAADLQIASETLRSACGSCLHLVEVNRPELERLEAWTDQGERAGAALDRAESSLRAIADPDAG